MKSLFCFLILFFSLIPSAYAISPDSTTAYDLALAEAQASPNMPAVIHLSPGGSYPYHIDNGDGTFTEVVYTNDLPWPGWAARTVYEAYRGGAMRMTYEVGGFYPYGECSDVDNDGVCDIQDNCIYVHNPLQEDEDMDGEGDACDSDSDDDGICNNLDPYPLDASEFQWTVNEYQKDDDGFYSFLIIQTGSGHQFSYGTQDDERISYLTIGGTYEDSTGFLDFFESNGFSCDDENYTQDDPGGGQYEDVDLEDGLTGGGTDSEMLSNIENNTAAGVNNQQALSSGMTDIANSVVGIGEELEDISSGIDEDRIDAESAVAGYSEQDMTAVYSDTQYTQAEADEVTGEVEGTGLTAVFDFIVENSPAQAIIDEMQITTTGYCSVTVPSAWGSYELNMCSFADELATWGDVLLMVSSLSAFMIIFRRGS